MKAIQLTLDSIFQQKVWCNLLQLQHYEKLYNMPRLQYLQHTCRDSLEYIKKKCGFVILVMYSDDGKIYVEHDWHSRWLPACSMYYTEQFHQAINRIARRISPHIELSHVEPILLVDNTFCHQKEAHTMHWIVYIARITNEQLLLNTQNWNLLHLYDEFIDGIHKYGNKDILLYIQNTILPKIIKRKSIWHQDNEISINTAMKSRYIIHENFMKPLLRLLWINKNKMIKKRILEQCSESKNIIDVSCGDDNLIHILAQDGEKKIIWNDISWSQINTVESQNNILFTNHSALDMPFTSGVFDIAICKNTLHHMENREQLLLLLKNLKRIAKKVIIVEIENPLNAKGIAWRLHKYRYRSFLKDVWNAYLNTSQTLELINHIFTDNYSIDYWNFKTPQGKYIRTVIKQL